jgi:VWFA-related protein
MRKHAAAVILLAALQGSGLAQTAPVPDPQLMRRPPAKAPSAAAQAGRLRLDVTVRDAQDKPVSGLDPSDFQLTDTGKPAKILSFHGFDGLAAKPAPPVEVILVIDEVNLPFQQIAFVRSELTRFLNQNGGKLAQPVSLMRMTDKGLRVQPRPTQDGGALVKVVSQIQGEIGYINPAMGGDGALERFQISERGMATIAENEAARPGRKLLIWIGPGWPMLEGTRYETPDTRNRQRYFDAIVELTNKLREARITVNTVSGVGGDSSYALFYQRFLKGVVSPKEASSGNLALKVVATQTGGRILGPSNDLVEQMNQVIADANAFYSISFNPPAAGNAEEYHELKVQVSKPGLTARTTAGYYFQTPGN